MERPSRLDYLPRELIDEMFYKQDWRDFSELLQHPRYAKYNNPDDPIWRELYHRRISSYPLPVRGLSGHGRSARAEGTPRGPLGLRDTDDTYWGETPVGQTPSYFEQFFRASGMADVSVIMRHYTDLVKMGFDRVIQRLDLSGLRPRALFIMADKAAERGYLSIIQHLWNYYPAMRSYTDRTKMTAAEQIANTAAEFGHNDIVEYLMTVAPNTRPQIILPHAINGNNFSLVKTLISKLAPLRPADLDKLLMETLRARNTGSPDFNSIVDYIISLYPTRTQPDFNYLSDAAREERLTSRLEKVYREAVERGTLPPGWLPQ